MFYKKFTEDDVLQQLNKRPMTVFELFNTIGCGDRTAQTLVKSLMDKGLIGRRNRSHPKKPIWEYHIIEGVQVKEASPAKRNLMGMARRLK